MIAQPGTDGAGTIDDHKGKTNENIQEQAKSTYNIVKYIV